MKPEFSAGKNIAVKVPPHEFDATVAFYQNVLGLPMRSSLSEEDAADRSVQSVAFTFGTMTLWVDSVEGLSQAETWLEVETNDAKAAAEYLAENDCTRRDEIEALPGDYQGFWVSNPANIIHLISERSE